MMSLLQFFGEDIGTETQTAISGTIEEFNRAHEKYKKENDSVDILIYFKDEPISPSEMDLEQLQKLQKFKSSLSGKGICFWSFTDLNSFEATLRPHIAKVAQKWAKRVTSEPLESSQVEESSIEDEEYGFLDCIELFTDNILKMESALSLMSEATEIIGERTQKHADDISGIGSLETKEKQQEFKRIIIITSKNMDTYADTLITQLPILSNSSEIAFDAMSKALAIVQDFEVEPHELEEIKDNIKTMLEVTISTSKVLSEFRATTAELPRITTQFNRSKKNVSLALGKVIKELESMINVLENTINIISESSSS